MAQYTFLQLKTAVEHALGRVPDTRTTPGQIVNRAIEHLFNSHPWSWRKKSTNISFVSGQGSITLPNDFQEVVEIERAIAGGYTGDVRNVTDAEYAALLRASWSASSPMGWRLFGGYDALQTPSRFYNLQIAPVPTSSVSNALTLVYMIRPFAYDATSTSNDSQVIEIPVGLHDTLMSICRAMAVSMEEQSDSHEWQVAKVMLERDIAADLRIVGNLPGAAKTATGTNFFTLKGEAVAALGLAASTMNIGYIVNDAVQMLWNAYRWQWKSKRSTINSVSGTAEYSLPADFGQLLDINTTSGHIFTAATEDEITFWQEGGYTNPVAYSGFYYAITFTSGTQASLRLYPAPGETTTGFFMINYERAPVQLVAEGDVPNLPASFFPVLRRLVVAMAKTSAGNPSEGDWAIYERMLDQAIRQDSSVMPNHGPLPNALPISRVVPLEDPRRSVLTYP